MILQFIVCSLSITFDEATFSASFWRWVGGAGLLAFGLGDQICLFSVRRIRRVCARRFVRSRTCPRDVEVMCFCAVLLEVVAFFVRVFVTCLCVCVSIVSPAGFECARENAGGVLCCRNTVQYSTVLLTVSLFVESAPWKKCRNAKTLEGQDR